MDALRLALALGLPALAGIAWLRWRWIRAPEGAWTLLVGYGYVIGMVATTLVMRALDVVGLKQSFVPIALVLAALAALGLWCAREVPWHGWGGGLVTATWRAQPRWKKAVGALLVLLLLARAIDLGLELVWSPLFAWDAWATWAPKARVWYELRTLVPFVSWQDWDEQQQVGAYTIPGYHYPPTVPLLQVWMCLALGRWDDSLMNLPWLGCAAALGLAFFGQSRIWGARPLTALLFTYALLSLPLISTHVALAGNADLWMATVYGLAAMAFFQWLRTGDRRQGILALGLALACPQVKVPGLVWMLTFVPALVLLRVPRRALLGVAALLLLALGLVLAAGGFAFTLPGLGEVAIGPEAIRLPYLGSYRIALHPGVGAAFVDSVFALATWHLFWYVWLAIVLVRLPLVARGRHRWLLPMVLLVVQAFAFVAAAYALGPLAEFAVDYTQVNRAMLHMVPTLCFVALALLHQGDDAKLRVRLTSGE